MSDITTGVTISELTPTATLTSTDCFEIDRGGGAYSITYEAMCEGLKESLGINELLDGLTEIIG